MVKFVRISKFVEATGYTSKAVYQKIHTGVWVEGKHYRRAPDGNILVDMEGFEAWVEGEHPLASSHGRSTSA